MFQNFPGGMPPDPHSRRMISVVQVWPTPVHQYSVNIALNSAAMIMFIIPCAYMKDPT